MSVLSVRIVPDPVLRQKSHCVETFDASLKSLIADLVDTMFASDGVGIAAPQVGVLSRVIICCDTAKRGDEQVFVNPEITKRTGEESSVECCLSVPGVSGEVKRATFITVKAQDCEGRPLELEAEALFARILQHELDHLNGVLFIDHVDSPVKDQGGQPKIARL